MFQVKAGDHYGFTWLDHGVIKYAHSDTQNYCENEDVFDEGEVAELFGNRHGNRDYSLRMMYTSCASADQSLPDGTEIGSGEDGNATIPIAGLGPQCSKLIAGEMM